MSALLIATVAVPLGCRPRDGVGNTDVKVLNYFRSDTYKSLDPPKQFDVASANIIANVYDPLLEYHYLKRPYELAPNLVEKMPELGADKLTYTFTLRKGIQFHDDPCFPDGKGRELTADDVIYSIKRFADVNVNPQSYPVLLQDRIKGLDAFREKTRQQKNIDYDKESVEGIKKIDAHTFQIVMSKPDPLTLMSFASEALAIVPKEAVDKYGDKLNHHAVGTGPFILADNPRRGVMVLKKNPNYHGTYPTEGEAEDKQKGLLASAGKKLPLVDEIRLPLIEESQPAMLQFRKGGLDWIGLDRNNFPNMAYKDDKGFHLKDEFAKKFELYWVESLSSSFIAINWKNQLLGKNKALRQALAYTINVPEFIDKMSNGRGTPLQTIVPIPIDGSQQSIKTNWYSHNLQKAKEKLKEAGYPDGKGLPPLVMLYGSTDSDTRQAYEFMRAQFAKAGINLKAEFFTFSEFLRRKEDGNFQLSGGGWRADYPDAENFYQLLYGPNQAPGPNAGSYKNAEFDRLYEQMRQMSPGPERNQIIEKMAAIVTEDVPVVLTSSPIAVGMHQKWLLNMKRNLMLGSQFKFLDIDTQAKSQGLR
ncbi:ABC transporter substrate-binding protein [Acaryochloris sp. IP29b_bin.137]|uniref:ABC transporter substrate-binding protein n=1 Tax=Acaryochloris sp. IP29b_bin.137 TaxID=2969217 RepID=UPI0026027F3C|nr:ABC transporter substrate-binding protein [Acaryochloris sp. IP29b_bin.137]